MMRAPICCKLKMDFDPRVDNYECTVCHSQVSGAFVASAKGPVELERGRYPLKITPAKYAELKKIGLIK